MPQPAPYAPSTSFTDHEAAFPTQPPPGPSLDAEFLAVADTLRGVLANLVRIQRDDGQLANSIVGLDALSPAALLVLGAGSHWNPRGAWAAATNYALSDVVSVGTASYVCSVAHVSGGAFDATKFILLFNSSGATPGDGTVTSAKLATGAVLFENLGFNALDLAGAIRAGGGLAAGTAPNGALLHAKLAAGAVYAKVERATDAQGAVGLQVIGQTVTWTLEQAVGSTALQLRRGATVLVSHSSTGSDTAGTIRATNGAVPTAGAGVGLTYAGDTGFLRAYDYTTATHKVMKVAGLQVFLQAAGVDVLKVTAAGVEITGSLALNGVSLGYLGIPQNQQDAAYQLALTDIGRDVYSENVAGQVITIPAHATTAFENDAATLIINDGAAPITIQGAGGVTLRLAGTATTGNRTLGAGGMAFLKCVKPDRWFVSGPGVS